MTRRRKVLWEHRMSGQTEARKPVSRWETALLSLFILSALWAGYGLTEKKSAETGGEATPTASLGTDSTVGSLEATVGAPSVDDASLPIPLPEVAPSPSIQPWIQRQAALTQKVRAAVARPLTLAYVFSLFPVRLHSIQSFEDFTILHGLPMAGSVFSAAHGPVCVDFRWTPIPLADVAYSLEIAKSRDFAFYRSFGSHTTQARIQIEAGADYFWRIRATRDRQQATSDILSFLVTSPPQTEEQKRMRSLASRVRDQSASISDLQYCP